MPPLLILESISASFFDETLLTEKVIPQSYDPAIVLIAEQIARDPADNALFETRLRIIIPQSTYAQLLQMLVHPLFEQLEKIDDGSAKISIALDALKKRLSDEVPDLVRRFPACDRNESVKSEQFRLCKAPQAGSDKQLIAMANNILEKQIPPALTFEIGQKPEIAQAVHGTLLARRYLPGIIVFFSFFVVGLTALIIFSPTKSVLKWAAMPLITAAILMALFIISISRLLLTPQFLQLFSPGQSALMALLVRYPLQLLTQWTFVIGAVGVIMFIVGLLYRGAKPKRP